MQPPSSAASFSFRTTPQGFFRKEAHLVPELVGPAAGQQEMIYLLTGGGACRFGLSPDSSPFPTFLLMIPATPPCLNARPPLVEVALSPDFSTRMCGIFPSTDASIGPNPYTVAAAYHPNNECSQRDVDAHPGATTRL